MENIATIDFRDIESQDDGCIVLRSGQGQVAVSISLKNNGDVEVFMAAPEAEKFYNALQTAIQKARKSQL